MSVRRLDLVQPEDFAFSEDNRAWANEQLAKYPDDKQASAVIPLLWRAQEQAGGWLPEPAIRYVADFLGMATIRVLEIATFYTMFNLSPVGRHFVQLCGTTPCWLRGADDLKEVCRRVIGPPGKVSEDGLFSWIEVECLGACVNAPMVQINKDYYEDLSAESFEALLLALKDGREVEPGPQVGRQLSCPKSGPTTLMNGAEAPAKPALAQAKPKPEAEPKAKPDTEEESALPEGAPQGLSEPRLGKADDLKQISGIGPKLETMLNQIGVYHFDQIATWDADTVAWIDQYLSFKGRIEREGWIEQAKQLAAEGDG